MCDVAVASPIVNSDVVRLLSASLILSLAWCSVVQASFLLPGLLNLLAFSSPVLDYWACSLYFSGLVISVYLLSQLSGSPMFNFTNASSPMLPKHPAPPSLADTGFVDSEWTSEVDALPPLLNLVADASDSEAKADLPPPPRPSARDIEIFGPCSDIQSRSISGPTYFTRSPSLTSDDSDIHPVATSPTASYADSGCTTSHGLDHSDCLVSTRNTSMTVRRLCGIIAYGQLDDCAARVVSANIGPHDLVFAAVQDFGLEACDSAPCSHNHLSYSDFCGCTPCSVLWDSAAKLELGLAGDCCRSSSPTLTYVDDVLEFHRRIPMVLTDNGGELSPRPSPSLNTADPLSFNTVAPAHARRKRPRMGFAASSLCWEIQPDLGDPTRSANFRTLSADGPCPSRRRLNDPAVLSEATELPTSFAGAASSGSSRVLGSVDSDWASDLDSRRLQPHRPFSFFGSSAPWRSGHHTSAWWTRYRSRLQQSGPHL
jgi:hypothetical protein